MKKILILLLLVSIFSCSVNDDTPRSQTEFLPIESVSMPDQFIKDLTHTINLVYYKPSSCHVFNSIYYNINGDERIVAIVSEVYTTSNDCQEIWTEAEASFNFRPTELGSYVFKFWQGENTIDNISEDTYLTYEIEVIE